MKEKLSAAVLGGDERQEYLAVILTESGFKTNIYGIEKRSAPCFTGIEEHKSAVSAVRNSDVVILPLPALKNGRYLNERGAGETEIEDILDSLCPEVYVFAGKMTPELEEMCRRRGIAYCDYYASEKFKIKNAFLTSEGALNVFMEHKKICVRGAKILVTGSGRVAKSTAEAFSSLGGDVTVLARNQSELAWLDAEGYRTADIQNRRERISVLSKEYDAIINTVPATLFKGRDLDAIPEGSVYIELASAPYGIDAAEAKLHGIEVIKAPSLPGKYAPQSAAIIMSEVIMEKLRYGKQ